MVCNIYILDTCTKHLSGCKTTHFFYVMLFKRSIFQFGCVATVLSPIEDSKGTDVR